MKPRGKLSKYMKNKHYVNPSQPWPRSKKIKSSLNLHTEIEERDKIIGDLQKRLSKVVREINETEGTWQSKWEKILRDCCDAEDEVDHLEEIVDDLNTQLEDAKESYERTVQELKVTEDNRKYACDHIQGQNKLIRDAKTTVETLRAEKETLMSELQILKESKVNSEHLAKKLLELQNENNNFKNRSDYYSCPFQRDKNSLYLPCGKCTSCKLDAAYGIIDRSAANVEHLECELNKTKAILDQTRQNITKANKERDIIEHNYTTYILETEKKNKKANQLLGAFQAENQHLREIVRRQRDALELISRGAVFKHHSIARKALEDVMEYKDKNNIW